MTKEVEKLMKSLDITEQEALQLIEDDKRIDKGEKLFELTKEQQKASKDARATGTKKLKKGLTNLNPFGIITVF